MNEFLTCLYGNSVLFLLCKPLQVFQIWRMPSSNCCFKIFPQVGFRSGLSAGHFWTHFVCNHFSAFWSGFWVSVILGDLWPLVMQFSDTGQYVALQHSLLINRFHDAVHTGKESSNISSKATPKHHPPPPCLNWLCIICPQYVPPEGLWLHYICSIKLQSGFFYAFLSAVESSWVSYHLASLFIQTVIDSVSSHCCILCL